MMIAARNAMLMRSGSSTPTARAYVQDGLIAMWDGIENAGWGTHDSSATVWKDLIGDNDITLSAVTTFDDNSFWRANIDSAYAGVFTNSNFSVDSVELVFNMDSTSRFVARFTPSCFVIISSNGSYVQYASSGNASVKTANFFWGNRVSVSACGLSETRQCYANGALCSAAISNSWEGAPSGLMNRNINSSGQASKGHIYSIRHYSRALTAAEVAANYAIDAARFEL